MERRWNPQWQRNTEVYSEEQVAAVIQHCGLNVVNQTASVYIAYCPFHANTDDPAFAVNKTNGLYYCFNPSCSASGTLEQLAYRLKKVNQFEFKRMVMDHRRSAYELIERLRATPDIEFVQFPAEPVSRMTEDLWSHPKALDYMHGRGFEDRTLEHFEIGYSVKQDMVIVPMHDPKGNLMGFIGRSIEGKVFKNSSGLQKSKTAWNFHRAKLCGDTVIIVESTFDAMRIHQAGYPNVVALLGGSLSNYQIEQLDKTFTTIIPMTDFDLLLRSGYCNKCHGDCRGHRPGRDLAWQIADALPNKKIRWPIWDDNAVFPHDGKDASDISDFEISKMLGNLVTSLEYRQLDLDRIVVVQ